MSYLANAGCEAFIAADLPGYIELAANWAGRLPALAEVRRRTARATAASRPCAMRRVLLATCSRCSGKSSNAAPRWPRCKGAAREACLAGQRSARTDPGAAAPGNGSNRQKKSACALVQQVPQLAIGWFLLGRMTLQRGSFAEAEAALRNAIALEGDQAIYFADWSVVAVLSGAACGSGSQRRGRAIALEPTAALSWLSLGNAIQMQGRLEDAVKAYEACLARDASLAAAWNNLGSVQQRLGRLVNRRGGLRAQPVPVADQSDTVRQLCRGVLTNWGVPPTRRRFCGDCSPALPRSRQHGPGWAMP